MPRRRRVTRNALSSLELSPDLMRSMVTQALEHIIRHVESLPEQPLHATAGGRKLARSLREPLPEEGRSFEALCSQLFGRIIPTSLNTASPGYLAYMPGGGLFQSAVADLITASVNRYVGVWQSAPGLVQIEENVIAWLATLAGLPEGSGGVLTTGGSMANLTAIVAARHARLGRDFLRGVLYTSTGAHHSVKKAALVAGFPPENVREIASDARFRLDLAALEGAIAADRAAGRVPFLVVASAGTTPTGAIDPLPAIADLAVKEGLWLHVDGAYGGCFLLTKRGQSRLAGIDRADSITLDPHKGLFVPYGSGCLLVRRLDDLRQAYHVPAAYLPPEGPADFADLSPELSREMRGLRVWLPLKMHGAGAFRTALDEKLDLAAYLADKLQATPQIDLVAPPELSLLAFRHCPPGLTGAPLDAHNRRLLSAINARQRVLLSGTTIDGMFLLRACVLSFRTHQDRIDALLEDLAAALADLAREQGDPAQLTARTWGLPWSIPRRRRGGGDCAKERGVMVRWPVDFQGRL
jgi:aromatic-L-amino-acid decarboxylase